MQSAKSGSGDRDSDPPHSPKAAHHHVFPAATCPMCDTHCGLNHCMTCGSALSSSEDVAYRCEQCGWSLASVRFCFHCGQPLRSVFRGECPRTPSKAASGFASSSSGASTPVGSESHLGMGSNVGHRMEGYRMEGYMNKVGKLSKMAKSRYFILEDRFLYYFEKHTDADPKGAIFLQGSSITVQADGSRGKHGIVVCNGRQGRRRVLYCNSREEQDLWLHALAKAANIASIHEFFEIGHGDAKIQIGKGKFATVYLGTRRDATKEKLAIKVIQKKGVSEDDREYMRTEIAVLRLVNHPNIVRMVDMFDEPEQLYLIMEHIEGGDLLRRLLKLPRHCVEDECVAVGVVTCLLRGLQYLHEHGITHRDLKPENILIEGPLPPESDIAALANIGPVKITDFGLSAITAHTQGMTQPLGTTAYAAPEILMNKSYDRSIDVWSLGVVTFVLLAGEIPFRGNNDKEIAKNVVKCNYEMAKDKWARASEHAVVFVENLLRKEPSERLSVEKALEHDFITNEGYTKITSL
eukprot:gnl/MRDRNA2_/MRDRNA2_158826_c0_seq1.p1 gnl/MRDRNA2_/MRDRNA2_158826_c0~~gnl/MRDRNA2_/MRDRNA2_158826_c0_seq1.p1  ORF type:complete len:559 (-),score=92.78 gnl/MRDRNA2_/MRDRNA2_158826_c0_seq1:66-1631(-)